MPQSKPYDDSVTEQQREVQEALLSMPGFGHLQEHDDPDEAPEEQL
jgi:hypothetical protein